MSSWIMDAKCSSLNVWEADALFFVERGGSSVPAKEFCFGTKDGEKCSVIADCASYAIEYRCEGFWGGMTERERKLFIRWVRSQYVPVEVVEFDITLGFVVQETNFTILSTQQQEDTLFDIPEPRYDEVIALEPVADSLLSEQIF
jgi:hypothetical protein